MVLKGAEYRVEEIEVILGALYFCNDAFTILEQFNAISNIGPYNSWSTFLYRFIDLQVHL